MRSPAAPRDTPSVPGAAAPAPRAARVCTNVAPVSEGGVSQPAMPAAVTLSNHSWRSWTSLSSPFRPLVRQ